MKKSNISKEIQKQINLNYIYKILDDYESFRGRFFDGECSEKNRKEMGLSEDFVYRTLGYMENDIINIIDKDDSILTCQDLNGRNLGMIAALASCEKVVLRTLENEEAIIQTDRHGQNVGFYSAWRGLAKATSKVLDNPVASTQQNERGSIIGMEAAHHPDMEDVVIKALQNKEASVMTDCQGFNIGIEAAKYGLIRAAEFALQNEEAAKQVNTWGDTIESLIEKNREKVEKQTKLEKLENLGKVYNNIVEKILDYSDYEMTYLKKPGAEQNRKSENLTKVKVGTHLKAIEKSIIKDIENNREVLSFQTNAGYNIGMVAARNGMESIVLIALDDPIASTQQNTDGENIGMLAAFCSMEGATLKALDNPIASTQQNWEGLNIGICAATRNLEKAVIKALDNEEASLQQTGNGNTLGMYAAACGFNEATLKALDNDKASIKQSNNGKNIGMYAAISGLEEAVLKALDNEEASLFII